MEESIRDSRPWLNHSWPSLAESLYFFNITLFRKTSNKLLKHRGSLRQYKFNPSIVFIALQPSCPYFRENGPKVCACHHHATHRAFQRVVWSWVNRPMYPGFLLWGEGRGGAPQNDFCPLKGVCPLLKFSNTIERTTETISYCFKNNGLLSFARLKFFQQKASIICPGLGLIALELCWILICFHV